MSWCFNRLNLRCNFILFIEFHSLNMIVDSLHTRKTDSTSMWREHWNSFKIIKMDDTPALPLTIQKTGDFIGSQRLCSCNWDRDMVSRCWTILLCLNSASASFRGAFEGQLRHNATWSLSQSEGSSRGSFFSLFLEDAPLRSFVASHIPRFFAHLKKKKEREKMATSRGVDRHFRGPGRQKSWRKGKTSGDATRKCSKG